MANPQTELLAYVEDRLGAPAAAVAPRHNLAGVMGWLIEINGRLLTDELTIADREALAAMLNREVGYVFDLIKRAESWVRSDD